MSVTIAVLSLQLCTYPICFADPAISDLANQLGIAEIGDTFRIDGHNFLCVHDQAGRRFLLDPASISALTEDRACPPAASESRVLSNVLSPPRPGIKAVPPVIPNIAAFSGAQSIHLRSNQSGACDPYLPFYFTITYRDGSSASFYVIVRLKQPEHVYLASHCAEAGQPTSYPVSFDEIGVLQAIDTGNGSTLIYGWQSDQEVEPVTLLVHTLPQRVWSSGGNVYLIPADMLKPQLEKAAPDVEKKYQALLRVIGEAG